MKKLVIAIACFVSLSAAYAATPAPASVVPAMPVAVADSVDLNDYVGKYKMDGLPFEYITVSLKDGKLRLSTGDQESELTPLKDPDKFDASGQATFLFVRDADKKVKAVTLDAQGMQFEGKKEA